MNGIGGIIGRAGHAEREQRHRNFCFFSGPIEIAGLLVIEIEFEGLFGVGGVARFHAGDVAANAVEGGDGLAELGPFILRGAMESEAQGNFVIAAQKVTQLGGEFAEIADLGVDFDMLGGEKRRVNGSFDDFSIAVGLD